MSRPRSSLGAPRPVRPPKRRFRKPAFKPVVIEAWSVRPWWDGSNPNRHKPVGPPRRWYFMPKGSRWDGQHHASITQPPSGQAYIVSSHGHEDDAFVDWDDAVTNALARANQRP